MASFKFKICMIGTLSVGKTSLVRRFVESTFSDRYLTTIGVKVDKKTVAIGPHRAELMLWDIEGPDHFKQLQTRYLRGTAAYFIVADSTRPTTLDAGLDLRRQINADLGELPWSLVLNKADLHEQWDPVLELRAKEAAGTMPVYRTSAKTGTDVDTLFTEQARRLLAASERKRA